MKYAQRSIVLGKQGRGGRMPMRTIHLAAALALTCGGMHAAHACTKHDGYPLQSYTFSLGDIDLKADPNLPVNGTIKEYTFSTIAPSQDTTAVRDCTQGSIERFYGTTALDAATKTYELPGVEGVRYQLVYPGDAGEIGGQVPDPIAPVTIVSTAQKKHMVYPMGTVILRFIKTGPIKGGTAPRRLYGEGEVQAATNASRYTTLQLSFGPVRVQEPTCEVLGNRNIDVQLQSADVSEFSGIGSSPPNKQSPFNIRLSCNSAVSNLKIKFDSQYAQTGMDGVLQITKQDKSAAGVGIQVRHGVDNYPVPFGTPIEISPVPQSEYRFPMSARYIQTGEQVKSGIANSMATFTIEYQ